MNLKAATLYQVKDYKNSVLIYYLVVVLVVTFSLITISAGDSSTFTSTGGIESATSIFLFVAGLNSFRESFLMLMQNGISRKTMFISRVISVGILSVIMAIIDRILIFLMGLVNTGNDRIEISGLYEHFFADHAAGLNALQRGLEGILLAIVLYLASVAFGYFITAAYYRMGKASKIAISVGVPVGIFFVLPIIDATMAGGRIFRFIAKVLKLIFGFGEADPYNLILSCFVAFVIFFGLSWLIVRNAVEKN